MRRFPLFSIRPTTCATGRAGRCQFRNGNARNSIDRHSSGSGVPCLFSRLAYWVKKYSDQNKIHFACEPGGRKELVKELIAHLFTADNVANEINRIFTDNNYRNDMLKGYADIKVALGEPGTARRTAENTAIVSKTNHNCS